MQEVTEVLDAVARGEPEAAGRLLPLLYDELRRLAAQKLAHEKPGQTLQATALVHEAYLRLVGGDPAQPWNGRGHFFAAAAEAMRRILVENARRKQRLKHGGDRTRRDFDRSGSPPRKPPKTCWPSTRRLRGWRPSIPRRRSWCGCAISEA